MLRMRRRIRRQELLKLAHGKVSQRSVGQWSQELCGRRFLCGGEGLSLGLFVTVTGGVAGSAAGVGAGAWRFGWGVGRRCWRGTL